MSGRVALTEPSARSAEAGGRKSPIFDDELIGFGLQVCDTGHKTLTSDYTVEDQTAAFPFSAS